MEKQILEILHQFGIDKYPKDIELMSAISELFKGMYPEEFIRWLLKEECYQNNIWGIDYTSEHQPDIKTCNLICERHGIYPVGIDDIFTYWIDEIKDK